MFPSCIAHSIGLQHAPHHINTFTCPGKDWAVPEEQSAPISVTVTVDGTDGTPMLDRLMCHAEDALELFVTKHREYGPNNHHDLGTRAQFVDINRKTLKLRGALWDGADTSAWTEQPDEIARDLIGHCLLLLELLEREREQGDGE
jgi:hypothetical protein